MPQKSAATKTKTTVKAKPKAKPAAKVKVGTNAKPSQGLSMWQSTRTRLTIVLAFVLIGVGTILWAHAATTTSSLWSDDAVPQTISTRDSKPVELGVKFKSKYAGSVVGVRFYKGTQNTGTHTGSLWTSTGKLLGRVTFTNETNSGWQEADFAHPINIAANTTYVASYYDPHGYYSSNNNYFTQAHTSADGVLTAPKNAGVYMYAGQTTFPKSTYKASNYWVDVVVSNSRFNPTPKPQAPTNLKATAGSNVVNLTWTASSTAGITKYTILRGGQSIATIGATGTTTNYSDAQVTAGTTYSYQVEAVDGSNNVSDPSNTATITVPTSGAPTPTPTPIPTPQPTGSYVQPGSVGYLGPTSALTVYEPGGAAPDGCSWVSYGLRCDQTNLTLDHVWIKDSVYWTGTGDLTVTNSIVQGGAKSDEWYAILAHPSNSGPLNSTIKVTDSTVGWLPGKAFPAGEDTAPIWSAYGNERQVVERCDLSGMAQGIDPTEGSIISDNWIHGLVQSGTASAPTHLDGVYSQGGSHITISGNYVDAPIRSDTTAAVFIQDRGATDTDITIQDNFLRGGAFTLRNQTGIGVNVINNTFAGSVWGDVGDLTGYPGTFNTWSGNVHVDGGVVTKP